MTGGAEYLLIDDPEGVKVTNAIHRHMGPATYWIKETLVG